MQGYIFPTSIALTRHGSASIVAVLVYNDHCHFGSAVDCIIYNVLFNQIQAAGVNSHWTMWRYLLHLRAAFPSPFREARRYRRTNSHHQSKEVRERHVTVKNHPICLLLVRKWRESSSRGMTRLKVKGGLGIISRRLCSCNSLCPMTYFLQKLFHSLP
jgi:hypothetical protein